MQPNDDLRRPCPAGVGGMNMLAAEFLGWRGAVLLLIVILAIYVAFTLWRLQRMKSAAAAAASVTRLAVAPAPTAAPLAAPDPVGFATQQFMRGVEGELEEMRRELAELREEVGRLKASRQTAPHYTEAMTLAEGGADAQTVAARCGISLAEAELVLALSRRDKRH